MEPSPSANIERIDDGHVATIDVHGTCHGRSPSDGVQTAFVAGAFTGLRYVHEHGYSNWRLPICRELLGILDYGKSNPAIDKNRFPDTDSSHYWSSTSDASGAWHVNFHDGHASSIYRGSGSYVRCVRGGL